MIMTIYIKIFVLSTSFPEGDIVLEVKGPDDAAAFLGNEFRYVPQGAQPHRYCPVVIAVKKGEDINNYKLIVKDREIEQSFVEEKTSGELKIGDSFRFQLDENTTLHGTLMDIRYMKTEFGSSSSSSEIIYRSSVAQAFVMYSIESTILKEPIFKDKNVLTMLGTHITSDYKTIGFDLEALDYKSDIIIKPSYALSSLGYFTTNGTIVLAVEAYVNENIWNKGNEKVGFDKNTSIHFGDFSINFKNE